MTSKAAPSSPQIGHLSPDMRASYRRITRKWALSEHHRRLLICAAESHDRMCQARDVLATEGITVLDRHGQTRPHPAVGVERDSRIAFARMLRELGLSDEASDARPPRPTGRYQGRA
jgi:P27 family predicted phage terminase small subunit